MLRKTYVWMRTQPSVQSSAHSSLQKYIFGTNSLKLCKNRYQSFLALVQFRLMFLLLQIHFAEGLATTFLFYFLSFHVSKLFFYVRLFSRWRGRFTGQQGKGGGILIL